jgi:hypothetical protein
MIYESKNGFYHKTYKYYIIIGILLFTNIFSGAFYLGSSISAARRYRAESRRLKELELTVREQEQRIKSTSTELGELIQSSDERIKSALTGTKDLRKTMQFLENEYNSMLVELSSINNNLNNTKPN